jgi:hypothetical protein
MHDVINSLFRRPGDDLIHALDAVLETAQLLTVSNCLSDPLCCMILWSGQYQRHNQALVQSLIQITLMMLHAASFLRSTIVVCNSSRLLLIGWSTPPTGSYQRL